MFDLEKSIKKWLKTFSKYRAFSHGSIREMELHLRDHIEDLTAKGLNEKDAFNKAVTEFGQINSMAKEEFSNQIPKSTIISILNTAMIRNYFKIATRNFWKNKFYATVNIMGLTIGLSIVFLISLFVTDELSFDQFHAKQAQLYRVVENQYYDGQPVFPVAVTPTVLAPSLKAEYPEIENTTRLFFDNAIFESGESKIVEKSGILADKSIFEMLTLPLVDGSIEAFKENLNAVIIDEELAAKYFPESSPISKTISLDDEEYVVIGVMQNVPNNSHLDIRYIRNFEKYLAQDPDRANSWGSNWLYTYVELTPDTDLNSINEKIIGQIKANNEGSVTDIYLQPMSDIYLGSVDFVVEVSQKGEMIYVRIFTVVALFILLISCINFMNMSTAQSAKRAKEVGLRKTVGGTRKQLVFQFLTESVLLSFIAVIFSAAIVAVVLPYFNQLANKQFELSLLINPVAGVSWGIGIIAIALLTGLIAGSYPAIFLSSLSPVSSLKPDVVTGKQGSGLRKVLVVLQFVISVVLIIGTVVIYKQLQFIQNTDLGYNKENIIYLNVPQDQSELFANELRVKTGIMGVGRGSNHPAYIMSSTSGIGWPGKNPEETILIHITGVDENYMSTMEMKMIDGRQFEHADSAVVIINEKAREIMGLDNPIGQVIERGEKYTIVGVVGDFNFKSVHVPIEPLMIFKTTELRRVFIRYNAANSDQIVASIGEVWSNLVPDREFDYYFLEDDFKNLYEAEQRTSQLSAYFAGLAIFISCLGLFGLVSYATEQRTKEVGIRKVLGASINDLFMLLTGDFTRLVIISLFISIPIGWYLMDKWLEGFAYHIELSIWVFVFSGAVALAIALITVSYQSIRASIDNPVHALRSE
ncbi:MAG: hypothetical protein DRI71_04210 [Bacteroidetes bacterium]|nr:MAG: hypothetical protein DRI71_04210 [Bacteroidota bacterium]